MYVLVVSMRVCACMFCVCVSALAYNAFVCLVCESGFLSDAYITLIIEKIIAEQCFIFSHVVSTAAGNFGVPVVVNGLYYGRASGMAPRAR